MSGVIGVIIVISEKQPSQLQRHSPSLFLLGSLLLELRQPLKQEHGLYSGLRPCRADPETPSSSYPSRMNSTGSVKDHTLQQEAGPGSKVSSALSAG